MMQQKKTFKNIIMVNKDSIDLKEEDGSLKVTLSDKFDFYDITKMDIIVKKDTSLLVCYSKSQDVKLDISITVYPNVSFSFFEEKKAKNTKIQTKYFLNENTNTKISKFYDGEEMRELDLFYLNGEGASVSSNIKGILKETSIIDMMVYHNFKNTKSKIDNRFVTIKKGAVKLNVTTMIYSKMKNCIATQNNFILKENKETSTINPILLIEENEVEASHSANITTVPLELLYYMKTRGLSEENAKKLYIRGFLEGDFYNIDKYMTKYWR